MSFADLTRTPQVTGAGVGARHSARYGGAYGPAGANTSMASLLNPNATTTSTTTISSSSNNNSNSNNKTRLAIETASLKLEQFQRQVVAIKRASLDGTSSHPTRLPNTSNNSSIQSASATSGSGSGGGGGSGATGLIDDDLHDRIRFACLLQEEIAKGLTLIPQDPQHSLIKRKLCKDFEVISSQLENSVLQISKREQAMQEALRLQQQQDEEDGRVKTPSSRRIVVEHQGQVIQFEELQNDIAHNEALIEEREKDIARIHQSVAQVHEIFRDLAAIVNEQQTCIDEVETHVHESLEQTKQGLDQVRKASDMQRTCVIQ